MKETNIKQVDLFNATTQLSCGTVQPIRKGKIDACWGGYILTTAEERIFSTQSRKTTNFEGVIGQLHAQKEKGSLYVNYISFQSNFRKSFYTSYRNLKLNFIVYNLLMLCIYYVYILSYKLYA